MHRFESRVELAVLLVGFAVAAAGRLLNDDPKLYAIAASISIGYAGFYGPQRETEAAKAVLSGVMVVAACGAASNFQTGTRSEVLSLGPALNAAVLMLLNILVATSAQSTRRKLAVGCIPFISHAVSPLWGIGSISEPALMGLAAVVGSAFGHLLQRLVVQPVSLSAQRRLLMTLQPEEASQVAEMSDVDLQQLIEKMLKPLAVSEMGQALRVGRGGRAAEAEGRREDRRSGQKWGGRG